ncbi:BCCT family transporter [uncultured Deefgea sp.]|uniref:BCCT family transporter n=1 Tax=uncultured Deefgea sp. TaxID=1304914 RepID=UPI002625F00C|nr:BCCT family transporter [uncultured Deefgea sp.]
MIQRLSAHTFRLPVFIPSLVIIISLLAYCTLATQHAEQQFVATQAWITQHFSWFYIFAVSGVFIFLIGLAVSSFGNIRLGRDDSEPEYSFLSWLAMLFAAGMGIGLMYYGVGEPLQHFVSPPTTEAKTMAAAGEAMNSTFLHWGFHAWAVYGLVGLVLAYFGYRYNLPLTLRSGLYPILKEKINGPIGHAVDIFALCCTLFGLAPSVGLGAGQLAAGISRLTGWDTSGFSIQLLIIATVMILAGLSAATGIGKGVRRLSELNLFLALALLLFVLFTGPTLFLLSAMAENVSQYIGNFGSLTFRTFAYADTTSQSWFTDWTILYWAWWISWSPFVGLFIAKISRGRTIREFVVGVILIPSAFTFLWMTVFGNSVIWFDMHVANGALSATSGNIDALLFNFFQYLPLPALASALSLLLIAVFFVTSADSGALMLDSLASKSEQKSPIWQRLLWVFILGTTASILLWTGGQKALMTMTLIAALPFTVIIILLAYSLWRGLASDQRHSQQALSPTSTFWNGEHWKMRLEHILRQSSQTDVNQFITTIVEPALNTIADEMRQQGCHATIQRDNEHCIALVLPQNGMRDFVYGVRAETRPMASFALSQISLPASDRKLSIEPMTFFADGRKGYNVEYLRQAELIADVLKQYERYLSLSHTDEAHLMNTSPLHT